MAPAGGHGFERINRRALVCAAAMLLAPWLVGTAAADGTEFVLLPQGQKLGSLETTGAVNDLRFVVDLQGDVPSGTYVWATFGSNQRRQRTNEGYWIPWDGNLDDLIDNQFPVEDGKVTFKVLDEDLGDENQGITINIGYKVGNNWKFGVFPITPKNAGP